jgi:hypothetical protein
MAKINYTSKSTPYADVAHGFGNTTRKMITRICNDYSVTGGNFDRKQRSDRGTSIIDSGGKRRQVYTAFDSFKRVLKEKNGINIPPNHLKTLN